MNIKMTTTSQLSTTESKNRNPEQTKQMTRTGTKSQKWRSHGGLSEGEWVGGEEEKVQRISSINDR